MNILTTASILAIMHLAQFSEHTFAMDQDAGPSGSGHVGKRPAESTLGEEPAAKKAKELEVIEELKSKLSEMDISEEKREGLVELIKTERLYREFLIEGKKDTKDADGSTPLHLAAVNGHEKVAALLLEKGADIKAKAAHGSTPLHRAAMNGHEKVAALLLEKGADIEAKSANGNTPLHWAAWYGKLEIAQLLLEKGADKEAKDAAGWTPLHRAALNGHEKVAALLLEKGADKETTGAYGNTPLHLAAENGHEKVAALLLEKGADIEAKSANGNTPLHLAARYGELEIAQLLLARGADIEAKSADGRTPLDLAANHEETASLLSHFTAFHNRDAAALMSYIHQGKPVDLDLMKVRLRHTRGTEAEMTIFINALKEQATLETAPEDRTIKLVLGGREQEVTVTEAKAKVPDYLRSFYYAGLHDTEQLRLGIRHFRSNPGELFVALSKHPLVDQFKLAKFSYEANSYATELIQLNKKNSNEQSTHPHFLKNLLDDVFPIQFIEDLKNNSVKPNSDYLDPNPANRE